jgi:hypothetical protein
MRRSLGGTLFTWGQRSNGFAVHGGTEALEARDRLHFEPVLPTDIWFRHRSGVDRRMQFGSRILEEIKADG